MAKADRIGHLQALQVARGNSIVISYLTSTRQGLDVKMSMDVIRKIYEHLLPLAGNKDRKIDLFLYSNGGDGTMPWRLVTLIKEFTNTFSVIIPFNAFSAATLTALGANEIIMHSMGMLGPTDATVSNPFNPEDPRDPNRKLGISVEDVTAFISLIKEDVGINHEDELVQAFNKLPEKIHPLALGNVKRSLAQSRMIAKKLLGLHMDKKDGHEIDEIVDNLTSKLYFHGHPINRTEAKDMGLSKVVEASPELETLIWNLYKEYETELMLDKPFSFAQEFISRNPGLVAQAIIPPAQPTYTTCNSTAKLIYIESETKTDLFSMEYVLSGYKAANGVHNVSMSVLKQEWGIEN